MTNLFKKLSFLLIILLLINKTNAQVGIGTLTPDPSAALHVYDTARGMLIPRLTATQRVNIQNPAEGLLVYQTSDIGKGFWYFTNGQWKSFSSSIGKATVILSDTITNAEAQLKIANEVGSNTQEIRILRCTNLTSVDLSMISTLIEIDVTDNPVLQTLNFSNLTSVDGGVYINNCPQLNNLSIGALTRVGRTFNGVVGLYIVNTHVPSVNLPQLTLVAGGIRIKNDSSLTSISMPLLNNVLATGAEGIDISSNPVLSGFSFPVLKHVNQFKATGVPVLSSANISSLAIVDFSFTINCGTMTSFSFPSLSSIYILDATGNALATVPLPSLLAVQSLSLYGPALQSISLPVTDSISSFTFKGNALTSIAAPLLRVVNFMSIDSASSLTSVSFPILQTIGMMTLVHCSSLASISFPSLTSLTAWNQNNISNNANLTSISFDNLSTFAGSDFYLSSNKLPSSVVNALLHKFATLIPLPTGRTLNFHQVPAAPPTGQGIIDKATLVAAPNTVTTD